MTAEHRAFAAIIVHGILFTAAGSWFGPAVAAVWAMVLIVLLVREVRS